MTEFNEQAPPRTGSFELQGNALVVQMELTSQMVANLPVPTDAPPRFSELKKAVENTVGSVSGMLHEDV